jgi:hypothetical protein
MTLMPEESRLPNRLQTPQFSNDFFGEDRHELVAKLAYEHWEARGRPFGSPDVDWFAAERALYESLVASGLVSPSRDNRQSVENAIYR